MLGRIATVVLLLVTATGCGPSPATESPRVEVPVAPLAPIPPIGREPSMPVAQAARGPSAASPLGAPFAVGQVWSGTYTCPQGPTEARLRLEGGEGTRLVGTFEFHHRASGKKGSFAVVGGFDPATSRLAFAPVQWIERPSRYVTIGLDGELEEDVYKGFVTNRECGAFDLRRER